MFDTVNAAPREALRVLGRLAGDVDKNSEGGLAATPALPSSEYREPGPACEDCLKSIVNFIV